MLVGWRMGEDLEAIADLPDGELSVNVLVGTSVHSLAGIIELGIAKELQAWFFNRLKVSNISPEDIKLVTVKAEIKTDRIATNRKKVVSFDFTLQSVIETNERSYLGNLKGMHSWYERRPLTHPSSGTR